MQKWGRNKSGTVRFRCGACKVIQTRERADVTRRYRLQLFRTWLLGKLELSWYARKYGVTRQTLRNWFAQFWVEEPQPQTVDIRDAVLVIDGKYLTFNSTVLVIAVVGKVITWLFTYRENSHTWEAVLAQLKHIPFAIVCDGQRGMLKTFRLLFPRVMLQRCQFHVVQYCLAKLTQKPESVAGQELRELVLHITKVTTRAEFQVWLEEYIAWRDTYRDFLTEKTYQPLSLTPTGRPTWHYTHQRLHAAHSHLKNALPNLFTYLRYPEIPNTTNSIEGGINAPMQEKLRSHRGLTLSQRRVLIAHFLFSKQ